MTDVQQRKIHHVIGGGTVNPVRSHLSIHPGSALGADAFGDTARYINNALQEAGVESRLHLTKIASSGRSKLHTNDDIKALVDELVADPTTGMIVFSPAMADYNGQIGDVPSGKYAERLQTRSGEKPIMTLTPADKIVASIRKQRKDIFLVAFKTTTNDSREVQYAKGLRLVKEASANLVLANDTVTRRNMVIVPEEAHYFETADRFKALEGLMKMALSRSQCHFTRSTVLADKPRVPWQSDEVPASLREVVDHLIARGAYQPFLGKTAGHFAARGRAENEFLTSARKENFLKLPEKGLVRVFAQGADEVVSWGAKPSVGGQSQRIIFTQYPQLDCIAHFHGEMRNNAVDNIPIRPQWPYECGSHECGRNTADGLKEMRPGIFAVMLDEHGPNIVFNRDVPAAHVIQFVEDNFALGHKTGGAFPEAYRQLAAPAPS